MWSSAATRYQDGLLRQAGSVTAPFSASTAVGTWESAMNAASFSGTSAAKDAANLCRSRNRNPLTGGRIGGTGAPGGGSAISELTDFPCVGRERRDVGERGDIGVLAGLGDDDSTVGCEVVTDALTPVRAHPRTEPFRNEKGPRLAGPGPFSRPLPFDYVNIRSHAIVTVPPVWPPLEELHTSPLFAESHDPVE